MKAQALRDTSMTSIMQSKRTLELNAHHRIVRAIHARVDSGQSDERVVRDLVFLLYETALLVSGFSLPNPAEYAQRIHKLVGLGLGVEEEVGEGEGEAEKVGRKGEAPAAEGEAKKDEMPALVDEESVMEEVD